MELYARFENAAKTKGMSMTALLRAVMEQEAVGQPITRQQERDMAKRMKSLHDAPWLVGAEKTAEVLAMAVQAAGQAGPSVIRRGLGLP